MYNTVIQSQDTSKVSLMIQLGAAVAYSKCILRKVHHIPLLQIVWGGKFSIGKCKTFPNLCNRPWPCKTTNKLQMFFSELQFNFATAKLFYFERFAIYSSIGWLF